MTGDEILDAMREEIAREKRLSAIGTWLLEQGASRREVRDFILELCDARRRRDHFTEDLDDGDAMGLPLFDKGGEPVMHFERRRVDWEANSCFQQDQHRHASAERAARNCAERQTDRTAEAPVFVDDLAVSPVIHHIIRAAEAERVAA